LKLNNKILKSIGALMGRQKSLHAWLRLNVRKKERKKGKPREESDKVHVASYV
jgi:hypothetical protein